MVAINCAGKYLNGMKSQSVRSYETNPIERKYKIGKIEQALIHLNCISLF